jgi:redox-sensitive bicupin YhaK (pirin superfamily)
MGELKAASPPPDSWASDSNNHVAIWNIAMEANATFTLPASVKGVNRSLYFFEGYSMAIEGKEIRVSRGVDLDSKKEVLIKNGHVAGRYLLLQGKPIGEKVVQHGPFVMNSIKEIHQTMLDYQKTQFGGWPWPNSEHVHPKTKGRFAQYADGSEELR